MFAKIERPSSTAATIEAKLSSARTMSAAPFATSVPVMPIATPMSAALRAGASFTPSPVMAAISPLAFSARTMRSLCSGATRAYTETSRTACSQDRVVHPLKLGAGEGPLAGGGDAELARDGRRGDRVVTGDHQRSHAGPARPGDRGAGLGSRRVDHPHHPEPDRAPAPPPRRARRRGRRGGVCDRRRRWSAGRGGEPLRSLPRTSWRRTSVSGRVAPPTRSSVQRARRTSGAPLAKRSTRSRSSPSAWAVLMSFRSDENGTSPTRGKRSRRASTA